MAKRAGVAAPEYTPAPEAARAAGHGVVTSAAPGAGQRAVTSEGAPGAGQGAVTSEGTRTAGQAVATPEMAAGARVARQAAAKSVAAAHPADPKVWLQQINALRAAGKKDQAEAEMRRFKAAFPDYAIPAAPAAAPAGPVSPTPDLPKK